MTFELYLPTGPDGLRVLRYKGRTVYAVQVPRTEVARAEDHHEALSGVGLYFLLRQVDGEMKPHVYIGEAENCAARLRQHDSGKEFWTHAVVVLDRDDFHKGQAKYLEGRAERAAREARRYRVVNGTTPAKAHLPEAQRAAADEAFRTLSVLLDVLGAPVFTPFTPTEAPPLPPPAIPGGGVVTEPPAPVPVSGVTCRCARRGADARGVFDGRRLTVLAGSSLAHDVTPAGVGKGIVERRERYRADGKIAERDGRLVFVSDVVFDTPSGAADVVMGTSANGWREWHLDDGRPLKVHQPKR